MSAKVGPSGAGFDLRGGVVGGYKLTVSSIVVGKILVEVRRLGKDGDVGWVSDGLLVSTVGDFLEGIKVSIVTVDDILG